MKIRAEPCAHKEGNILRGDIWEILKLKPGRRASSRAKVLLDALRRTDLLRRTKLEIRICNWGCLTTVRAFKTQPGAWWGGEGVVSVPQMGSEHGRKFYGPEQGLIWLRHRPNHFVS